MSPNRCENAVDDVYKSWMNILAIGHCRLADVRRQRPMSLSRYSEDIADA